MISKITYSVFLFLLLFTLISTNIRIEIWHIRNRGNPRIISRKHKATVNHEEGYIFRVEEDSRADIIYCVGAQSNAYIKIKTAETVGEIKQKFYENSTEFDVYITRATSKAGINTFQELLHNVIVKTPKLYRVKGALAIRQVQLSCDVINKDDSFVLDNGLWVAVYHSPTSETKRKIADSLAAYIVQAEHDEDQKSSSDYDGNSENTLETFCNKILNALQGISQNSEGNSTVVKKLSKKDIIAITAEAALFENKKKKVFELLKKNMVLTETHFPHNSRILSTPTTSSSTVPTHTHKGKNSKAAKRETISKATKNIPFLESVFGRESKNVAAISTSTDPEI